MTMAKHVSEFLRAVNGGRGELDAWLERNNEADCRAAILGAIAEQSASDIATLEQENRELLARMERLQGIADAAKNLVAQKGRHNTEIAYRRLEEAVKKGE